MMEMTNLPTGGSSPDRGRPILRARDLVKDFLGPDGVVHALAAVSLDLYAGEVVAIVGRSGSGKTTLLQMLGLLSTPTGGSLELLGNQVRSLRPHEQAAFRRRHLGFVFQSFNLLPQLSALENVELPMLGPDTASRAHALLDSLGMGERLGHRPDALSAGEQQRVAIARAVSNEPGILLADEPSGNLDQATETELLELLRRMAERGCCVVIVTHSRAVAEIADRVITLDSGRVAVGYESAEGTTRTEMTA
jgi:ABC-type lipoprotein export system ATPase subunit